MSFGRGEEIKYLSHLDLLRLWERALRRAGVPFVFSEGFHPRPRMSLAAALPVGVTSEAELLDLFLEQPLSPQELTQKLRPQLPKGIELFGVAEVAPEEPPLQIQTRFAEYLVTLETDRSRQEIEDAIKGLLASRTLPRERHRPDGVRRYDLRPLVDALWVAGAAPGLYTLGMRLVTDNTAAGRPDEVVAALGFEAPPWAMHRSKLILGPQPPGRRQPLSAPRHRGTG